MIPEESIQLQDPDKYHLFPPPATKAVSGPWKSAPMAPKYGLNTRLAFRLSCPALVHHLPQIIGELCCLLPLRHLRVFTLEDLPHNNKPLPRCERSFTAERFVCHRT